MQFWQMQFPELHKAPLGGIDKKTLMSRLQAEGPKAAAADFARDLGRLAPRSLSLPKDEVVLILGGSNGIGRALAMQLLFAERANIFVVHNDSERLQIGPHHVAALRTGAEKEGLESGFVNNDATNPKVLGDVIMALGAAYKRVHVFNSIAAGAPKRYAEHGSCEVPDIDVAMDPIRQITDFGSIDNARSIGRVQVDIASQADIDRTHRLMGTSTQLWADALAQRGLLDTGSIVAFADYDFEPDNPVYGMGPLAGAKHSQRQSMALLREKYGVRALRVCYPAMNTTALSAIPGGVLMYALTACALGVQLQSLPQLAGETMQIFGASSSRTELHLDAAYQRALLASKAEIESLSLQNWKESVARAFGAAAR